MSLKLKFSIFISVIIFVLLTSVGGILYFLNSSALKNEIIERYKITAERIVPYLMEDLGNYYVYQFDTYAKSVDNQLKTYDDIDHFRIINTDGQILFDTDEIKNGKYTGKIRHVSDPAVLEVIKSRKVYQGLESHNGESEIKIITPYIDRYGASWAVVEFHFSKNQIDTITTNMTIAFLTLFGIFAVSGIVFSLIFVQRVMKPVKKLTNAAEYVSSGNIDFEVDISSKDEFGQLATAFNQMIKEIRGYQRGLEEKVNKRTEELERMNNLMVGRELKMIELKKEISELKAGGKSSEDGLTEDKKNEENK